MIFRWLYIRRMRAMFSQYMLPGAFEEKIVPLMDMSETKAFRLLFDSYFPGRVLAKATPNDLIALRNKIHQVLADPSVIGTEAADGESRMQSTANRQETPRTGDTGSEEKRIPPG